MKTQNELVKQFFEYLDYTEESDNGVVFHPVTIGCCRVMMMDEVNQCLKDLKESVDVPKT